MTAKTTVKKAYGSTIFQRMCRNGHERTRADIRCAPALAADISDVNDGYFHHFVTERARRSALTRVLPVIWSREGQDGPRGVECEGHSLGDTAQTLIQTTRSSA